jgi:AcrR family transcriptional regulator
MVRAQLREQQQALAREHVLDAAEAVLAERGVRDTTLREIATRAEYSVGALYQFFENKGELLTAVLARRNDALLADLEAAVAATRGPVAALHAIVDAEIDHFRTYPGAWRLFEELFGGGLALARRLTERGVEPRQYLRIMAVHERVLADGAAAGVLVEGDERMLGLLLSSIVTTYLSEWLPGARGGSSRLDTRFTRDDLHALVERTFVTGKRGARGR